MQFISNQGRTIDTAKPVRVYRNLNKKGVVYSIQQNGLVVGYATEIAINQPKFVVNLKAVDRVRKNQVREVHAWIEGFVTEIENDFTAQISYNPYKFTTFYNVENNEAVTAANEVYFCVDGVYIN